MRLLRSGQRRQPTARLMAQLLRLSAQRIVVQTNYGGWVMPWSCYTPHTEDSTAIGLYHLYHLLSSLAVRTQNPMEQRSRSTSYFEVRSTICICDGHFQNAGKCVGESSSRITKGDSYILSSNLGLSQSRWLVRDSADTPDARLPPL